MLALFLVVGWVSQEQFPAISGPAGPDSSGLARLTSLHTSPGRGRRLQLLTAFR